MTGVADDAGSPDRRRLTRRATWPEAGRAAWRWRIRRATIADLPAVVRLFDEAVAWLVARGLTDQWGTEPVSLRPAAVEHIGALVADGVVAERLGPGPGAGTVDGFVSVDLNAPFYLVADALGDAAYMHALLTRRSPEARGLGATLLRWAEGYAAAQGRASLRTDCYADNPRLVDYYGGQGFAPCGEFSVGGQRGRFLQKPLSGEQGGLRREAAGATSGSEVGSIAARAAPGQGASRSAAPVTTGRPRSVRQGDRPVSGLSRLRPAPAGLILRARRRRVVA